MKQIYFFSLVCLYLLLTSQITTGQSFSRKDDLTVNRIRSTSQYKKTVKIADLFEYPAEYATTAKLTDSSNVAISFSSTNPETIDFDDYYYSTYGGQYFYYKIPAGAYGTDTLTINIDYNGFTAKALVVANVIPLTVGDDSYTTDIGETLEMNVVKNDAPSAYLDVASLEVLQSTNFGTLTNNSDGTLSYKSGSSTPNYSFENFEYRIADVDGNYDTATVKINIHKNAYASRVIEFMPAPGQYTNENIGQSNSAEKTLGTQGGMISLGAFGGYVIYGFDQPITNNPNNPYGVDFSVKGNAFAANLYGVWTEPAAVRVMKDKNGDGIPNDGEWYELAGSDYYMSSTEKNVKMTYYNPHYEERYTVPWKKDNGETGALLANAFHQHPYYPDPFDFECNKDSMTYEGSIIKSSLDMSRPGYIEFYRAPFFGYCDNRGNSSDLTNPQNPYFADEKGNAADGFDINWAVDKDGNHVELDQIDFVKIYTGGFANAGWLGEWSSEILGVGMTTPDPDYVPQDYYVNYIGITQLKVLKGHDCQFEGFLFKNGRPQTEGTQQWSSSKPEVGTIDNTGLFTAVDNGETWLYFSQKSDVPTDSIRMLVVELEGVMLEMEGNSAASSDSTSLIRGETISITAQGLDNIGDVLNGSSSNRYTYDTYTWTTSNPEIGTIDNGLFTGEKVGRTMVYAHSDSNPELSDSIMVIVNDVPKLRTVSDPVIIGYYDAVGEKTSSELFTTGTNSTTYLNSVASKNGLANPVIEKNVLKCNFPEGVYGTDTLTFNLTSYRQDTTISVTFIHEPDVPEKDEQILFVNNALTENPEKSSLNAYTPAGDTLNVIDDQLDAYSVNDVLVDGAFAFVSGDTYLSKYNLINYEQECTTAIDNSGPGSLAVFGNLVLLAKQSELVIYYKVDLSFCKKIGFTGKISNVKVVGDKAYVFLSNQTTDELTSVAVVELVKGEKQSENALAGTGFTASSIIANGTSIYLIGTVSSSGNTAVMEYNTQTEKDLLTENNSKLSNSLKANATITGDSILIPAGEGFVSYNISTKRFGAETLMKAQEDFYPTAIAYHASLNKYFATYSNTAKTASKGLVFDSEFAEISTFDSVQTAPAFLTAVDAFDNNDKPLPNLSQTLKDQSIYESTTYSVAITVAKNCFVDGENNFEIYPRYLEHTSWLTWNTNYTSLGNKKLDAFFPNTVDKDSVITIPVDAIDNYGFSATRFLNVTIKPRFYKPVVANPIADTVVVVNSADIKIPLADVFLNTPKRKVTFGKTVSGNTNSDLISTAVINDTLNLTLALDKTGEAIITLKDSAMHKTYGVKYVETTFKVAVIDTIAPGAPKNLRGKPTETTITYNWDAPADNVGIAGYIVYFEGVAVDTVSQTTYTAHDLDIVTTYLFEVVAIDDSGNKSEKASVKVSTIDETAPTKPNGLSALPTESSISLSWNASTDNVAVKGYYIYVDGYYKAWVKGTNYNIVGLNPETQYEVEVKAVDAAGNKSEAASLTISTIDKTAPSAPTNLVGIPSETSVALSWNASTDNVGVAAYAVYIDGELLQEVTETNYNAIELNAFTKYYFEIEAIDAAGNKSEKISVTVSTTDETAPSVPTGLVAVPSETSISLSWTASDDNAEVAGYIVFLDGDSIRTVSETAFTATGLDVMSEHTFEIQAFDGAGNKSEKALLTASTMDQTAPSIPSNLEAATSDTSVVLSWTASTDNIGVAGYVVYLNGDSIGTTVDITYTVVALEANTKYTFEVEAFDEAGNRSEKAMIVQSTLITGIEVIEENHLMVYPNPFNASITVEAKTAGDAVLYNISGKAIRIIKLLEGNNHIDTSALPSGVYLLKQEMKTVKLIKR